MKFIDILLNNKLVPLPSLDAISSFFKKYHLVFFILVHLILLNFNAAEWGDSYRILRASEHIKQNLYHGRFSYPSDEKRPPLYSVILATQPEFINPIIYGRLVNFLISIVSYVLFIELFRLVNKKIYENNILLSLVLFLFNPVLLYWSLRVYADLLLVTLSLLAFVVAYKFYENSRIGTSIVLGLIVALAVLTRFEGYILFGGIGLFLLFPKGISKLIQLNPVNIFKRLISNLQNVFAYIVSFLFFISPYLYFRNPFNSTYFQEPTHRTYDINTILIFVNSFVFLFGFIFAFYFFFKDWFNLEDILLKNIGITGFIFVELLLILLWPAAIPRLFIQIIPFLLIFLIVSIHNYFDDSLKRLFTSIIEFIRSYFLEGVKKYVSQTFTLLFFIGFYIGFQYLYKQQFLIVNELIFIFIVILSLLSIYFILTKSRNLFYFCIFLSVFVWSIATLYLHKNVHLVISRAGEFISKKQEVNVLTNDVSSVIEWYTNDKADINSNLDSGNFDFSNLSSMGYDYLIFTNEHSFDLEFPEGEYLDIEFDFSKEINGANLRTIVAKIRQL